MKRYSVVFLLALTCVISSISLSFASNGEQKKIVKRDFTRDAIHDDYDISKFKLVDINNIVAEVYDSKKNLHTIKLNKIYQYAPWSDSIAFDMKNETSSTDEVFVEMTIMEEYGGELVGYFTSCFQEDPKFEFYTREHSTLWDKAYIENQEYLYIKLGVHNKGYYLGEKHHIDNSEAFKVKNPFYKYAFIDKIMGQDRYETAALIADKQKYNTAILVNSNKSLADGLSASGLAGAVGAPILLTSKDSIPQITQKRLENVKKVYIVGSDNSISKNVEDILRSKGIEVKRLGGLDRYKTSYLVANEISKIKNIDKLLLVNGTKGEPDAMSVSPVASRDSAPIILTNGEDIPFSTNNVKTYIIGSTGVMSEKLENKTNATRIGGIDRFDTNKKIIKHFYGQPTEFYLSKSDKLVDALTGSPLAKEAPIVLVNNGSDKSILNKAKKLTALGGIDKTIIEECINAVNSQ